MADNSLRQDSLYMKRCKMLYDAASFKKPDKIPYMCNNWTWRFTDAGYSIVEAVSDYDKIDAANRHFLNNYHVDMLIDPGYRNPLRLSEVLGGSTYETTEGAGLIIKDSAIFSDDDLKSLTTDYMKTLWEKGLFNKYPKARNMTPQEFAEASKEFGTYAARKTSTVAMIQNEYHTVLPAATLNVGYEFLFNWFRGIKKTSTDLRRDPGLMKEVIKTIDSLYLDPAIQAMLAGPDGHDDTEAFDNVSGWLGHTILSHKQFEEFYWPSMKKIVDAVVEKGRVIYMFSEGNWLRFADLLADYPKGTIAMQVELDDIHEVREKAPNICIVGGLDSNVMGNGSREDCVEMAKRTIDDLGGFDGGLILSENKMISYPCDCKGENIQAVVEFLEDYR